MVVLQNEFVCAKFNEKGAELKSMTCNGQEYIWPGDPAIWAGSCPLMFPICSGLKDDTYYLDGKAYSLQKHGYGRFSVFEVESKTDNAVTFLLRSDEESKAQFPFDYELRLIYRLDGKKLSVVYDVKNLSADTMYFSIGGHEGYYCPEGIEEYDVIFPQKETLESTVLEGNLLGYNTVPVIENSDRIALKYDYFQVDALVFQKLQSTEAVLKNRNTGKALKVCFPGFDIFQIWTKPNAPYICLEPWCGMSDRTDTDQNFKTKQGIQSVEAGGTFVREHTIEILA